MFYIHCLLLWHLLLELQVRLVRVTCRFSKYTFHVLFNHLVLVTTVHHVSLSTGQHSKEEMKQMMKTVEKYKGKNCIVTRNALESYCFNMKSIAKDITSKCQEVKFLSVVARWLIIWWEYVVIWAPYMLQF